MDNLKTRPEFARLDDLRVYHELCQLHVEISCLTRSWPSEERRELSLEIQRSSNSAAAQLAQSHSDRHIRIKAGGICRARADVLKTIHFMYIAVLKGYLSEDHRDELRQRYTQCIRQINALEKGLERRLSETSRDWTALFDTLPVDPRMARLDA